jgi:hypothetical protein
MFAIGVPNVIQCQCHTNECYTNINNSICNVIFNYTILVNLLLKLNSMIRKRNHCSYIDN